MQGETRGVELSANWTVTRAWKLTAGASCLSEWFRLDPNSHDANYSNYTHAEPGYQLILRSQLHPTPVWSLDADLYRIAARWAQSVPAYTRLDAGATWRVTEPLNLSLWGYNLLQTRHLEDNGYESALVPSEMERAVTARITLRY